jgi:hypothetical protein
MVFGTISYSKALFDLRRTVGNFFYLGNMSLTIPINLARPIIQVCEMDVHVAYKLAMARTQTMSSGTIK